MKLQRSALDRHKGFTIVELLIVIVVIGILAAITIVAFNGVQQQARDSQRKSDVKQIAKALQLWSINTSKTFEELNTGFEGVGATGWYSSAYSSDPSAKNALVSAGYLKDTIKDPLNGQPGSWDYMLTRCTGATDNRRVVFTRLENPPSQTVTQQLQGSGCNHSHIATFSGPSYRMNYVVIAEAQ